MNLNNLKKYVSLNILSLLGYICFVVSLYVLIVMHPHAIQLDKLNNDWNGLKHTYDDVFIPYFYYLVIHIIISVFLMIGVVVEFVLTKKGIINCCSDLENTTKIKSALFYIGIALVPIPLYSVFLFYIFLLVMGI